MARRLDRSRPYGITTGPDYQWYEQDHRRFGPNGDEIDDDGHIIVELVMEPPARPAPPVMQPVPRPKELKAVEGHDISNLPNDELKLLVELNGGKWMGRVAAVKFLADK